MKKKLALSLILLPTLVLAESGKVTKEEDKLAEDPTRVTTTLGVSYSDNYDLDESGATFSGSLALDPTRKISLQVNEDASEWRVGGSWLFDIGIVNFNFGRREYSTGAVQDNYSVGTFIPMSYFGFEPLGIQIFPMAGYSYNTGDEACEIATGECPDDAKDNINSEFVMISTEAHSGYVGGFALKPITESLTLVMFGGGSLGSNDYSGYWIGGGLGYTIMKKHSLSAFTYKMDNSYGADTAFSVGYKYEF